MKTNMIYGRKLIFCELNTPQWRNLMHKIRINHNSEI